MSASKILLHFVELKPFLMLSVTRDTTREVIVVFCSSYHFRQLHDCMNHSAFQSCHYSLHDGCIHPDDWFQGNQLLDTSSYPSLYWCPFNWLQHHCLLPQNSYNYLTKCLLIFLSWHPAPPRCYQLWSARWTELKSPPALSSYRVYPELLHKISLCWL